MTENVHILDLISSQLPGDHVRSIVSMGEGLDHIAWLVNGEMVVRQAKTPDPDAIRNEVAVLHIVTRHATLPVPEVAFADPDAGLLAYRHLPGQPLMHLPHNDPATIAASLGAFLAAIHAIPRTGIEEFVPREDEPLREWLDEAKETFPDIAGHLPDYAQVRIAAFLDQPPPPDPARLAFCHNDLGAEHILVDPGTMRVTGIIDWSDAAITDPVRDLALVFRDLGPRALDAALAAYGTELTPEDRDRLVFHARCKLIEDIAFGIETDDDRYLDAALTHLGWTFAPA